MNNKNTEWEPLPDSRPSLPYVLFAAVVAAGVVLVSLVLLSRF